MSSRCSVASASQSYSPELDSLEGVSTSGFSLAQTFHASTSVVPRHRIERDINISCKNLFLNQCKINMSKIVRVPLLVVKKLVRVSKKSKIGF